MGEELQLKLRILLTDRADPHGRAVRQLLVPALARGCVGLCNDMLRHQPDASA